MNIKHGLLAFGKRGNKLNLKKLKNMHDKKALMPIQRTDMTNDERIKSPKISHVPKRKARQHSESMWMC